MGEVTREDVRELREALTDTMREGFSALTQRLDRLNGRVGIVERKTAAHETSIRYLDEQTGNQWTAIHAKRRNGSHDAVAPQLSMRAIMGLIALATILAQILGALIVGKML